MHRTMGAEQRTTFCPSGQEELREELTRHQRDVSQLPRKFIDKQFTQGSTHLDASKYSMTDKLFEQYHASRDISKVQVFEIGRATCMQGALTKYNTS